MRNQNDTCAINVSEVCRVSYLKAFCEKNPGKVTGKTTGGLQQPPPWVVAV